MRKIVPLLFCVSIILGGCTIEYSFYIRNCFDVPVEISITGLSKRAENFDVAFGNDTAWKGYLSYANEIVTIDRHTDKYLPQTMNVTLVRDSLSLRIEKIVLPAKSTFHIQSVTHEDPTMCKITARVNNEVYKLDGEDMETSKRNIYYLDIEP